MKSKNSIQTFETQKTMIQKQQWKQDLSEHLQKIKQPFLNRIQYSKLKIQNKSSNSKQQSQTAVNYEAIIKFLVQNLLQIKLQPATDINIKSDQSSYELTEKSIAQQVNKENKLNFDEEIQKKKQSQMVMYNHFTEWQGRDRQKVFKNTTNMQQQFDRVFNKKLGLSYPSKKRQSYSYRKQQKQMLQQVYDQLKDPQSNNCITFKRMYKFFDDCKLFFTVYGITNAELTDIMSCSAHKYPDRLTKEQFLELFLINTQSRTYDELENKVEKKCCMEQGNWDELRNLFNQLDTFGKGMIKTIEFLHKMKTVSASKELLECKVINFTNINKYYTFSKVLFELEHKTTLPKELSWNELKKLIMNYSHIETPTLDEIVKKQIMAASIIPNETNTFLIKDQTIRILKEEFSRCPKFNQHFVKSKYFCDELLSLQSITSRSKELVRNCPKGKGFINLLANIRMLHIQGPEYLDMDEMLTYFSVKGFQAEAKMQTLRKSFSAQSTTSEEEWQEKKKEERRAKRMKSLDQMDKIMKKMSDNKYEKEEKPVFKPVVVKQFNLTKPREHMTIRQRKVKQMIEEKQQKQLSEMKPFIPANPIPATCNGQRYLEQQTKQKIKRQLEREKRQKQREQDEKKIKHLMSNTKLFEKRDHFLLEEQRKKYMSPQPKQEFEAKPISWFIKERNLLSMIESQKAQKRKNRLRQTKEKYVFGYWKETPYEDCQSDFKKMTIIKNLQTCKNSDQSLQLEIQSPVDSANKAKSPRLKLGVVPDFAKLQKEFMEQLESKKKMRNPTVVKEFNLSVPKKRQPQVVEQKVVKKVSPSKKTQFNTQQMYKTQQPAIVGTTKKFQSMVEMTQRKMNQKRYEAELQELQEKERKKKEKIFARFMKKAIREQQLNKTRKESMKSTRRRNDQSMVEHQNQLRKMYERVLNRPFLFQTVSDNHTTKKKDRKYKKPHKRSQPKKVLIPVQHQNPQGYPEIPPLNYIQKEEQQEFDYDEGDYDEMMGEDGRYIVKAFDDGDKEDGEDEEEYYEQSKFRNSQMNQSF